MKKVFFYPILWLLSANFILARMCGRIRAPNFTNSDGRLTHRSMYQCQVDSGTALEAWFLLGRIHSDLQGWETFCTWLYINRTCCLESIKATFAYCEPDSAFCLFAGHWALQPAFLLPSGRDRGNWLRIERSIAKTEVSVFRRNTEHLQYYLWVLQSHKYKTVTVTTIIRMGEVIKILLTLYHFFFLSFFFLTFPLASLPQLWIAHPIGHTHA